MPPKPVPYRIIVSRTKAIESSLLVVNISPIPERIPFAQRISERTSRAQQLAPCIVLVFYNEGPSAVKQAHDVALQIVDVGIDNAVVADLRRTALRIVEEVQIVVVDCHVSKQLTVELVLRLGTIDNLAHTQPIVVVFELHGCAGLRHLLELAACIPGIRPRSVIQRISNGVVGNGFAVVAGQLVLPVGITIDIGNGLLRTAQRAGGVGILHFGGDVAATVVVVYPGGILMRIVHTDQLAEGIIDVSCGQVAALLGDDVAAVVVGILKRDLRLVDLFHQRGRAACAVSACNIGIRAGELSCVSAVLHNTSAYAAEAVIGVLHLVATAEANLRYAVVIVIGVAGLESQKNSHRRYAAGKKQKFGH